jgi:pimeloyl-ACP methyl ester carboxylesterase
LSHPIRIGLALGSGSARGWAHIGVIRALEAAGIRPDIVCGTSIGALVGAAYAADELALNPAPVLSVPTLMLHGEADGVSSLATSANKEAFFSGPYVRRLLPGVGHFPQREAPDRVADEVLAFLRAHP